MNADWWSGQFCSLETILSAFTSLRLKSRWTGWWTHLLLHLLLDLLQVGSQVHVDRVLGAQQSLQHGVGRHAHFLQTGSLELSPQIHNLDVEVSDLQEDSEPQSTLWHFQVHGCCFSCSQKHVNSPRSAPCSVWTLCSTAPPRWCWSAHGVSCRVPEENTVFYSLLGLNGLWPRTFWPRLFLKRTKLSEGRANVCAGIQLFDKNRKSYEDDFSTHSSSSRTDPGQSVLVLSHRQLLFGVWQIHGRTFVFQVLLPLRSLHVGFSLQQVVGDHQHTALWTTSSRHFTYLS